MTDPRIIPDEELAHWKADADDWPEDVQRVDSRLASRRILALIEHGKALAEQVCGDGECVGADLYEAAHARIIELQEQVDTLTRDMEECPGHLDVAAVVVRAEKAEAEASEYVKGWREAEAVRDGWINDHAREKARADAAEQRLADQTKAIRDLLDVPYRGTNWGLLHNGVRHIPAPAVHALLTEDGAS